MKKILLSSILASAVICSAVFIGIPAFGEEQTDVNAPITSPSMKSKSKYPDYNDTYFTYYSSIIGYKSNGLWGFYSANGAINIPPMYSEIEGINSKYIKVERGGLWGIIDTNGYQLMQPAWDSLDTINIGSGDLFKVRKQGLCGVVDAMGNPLIPLYYQEITRISDEYARVKANSLYGVWGMYEGKELVAPMYDFVNQLDRYFMVKRYGKWGLVDKDGNEKIKIKYDDIKVLSNSFLSVINDKVVNNDFFAVKNNNVWGTVFAQTGEEVIRPMYDKIEFGKDRYLKVKHGGKWGAVTYDNKVVIPINKGPLEINRELKKLY